MADLPIHYDRQFSVHLYWVSHGLLLLRSGKRAHDHKRIDILFCDVRLLGIPTFLDGIRITHHADQQVATRLDAGLCHFKIETGDSEHSLIASPTITVHKDDQLYHENSCLLPDFDFRSLVDLDRTP